MYRELFTIPFTNLTIKGYGLMMVLGFLSAVWLIRKLSKKITPDSQMITNAALYSLIAGVSGARLFYVIHYHKEFFGSAGNFVKIFFIWDGGLELLGGVILAIIVIYSYLRYHKLPIRQYLDILAIALLLALSIGRIGCFLSGCCFGKPCDVPWAVQFPYGSNAYISQVTADPERGRDKPYIELSEDFFGYSDEHGNYYNGLKPYELLTPEQQAVVGKGGNRQCLPVHPTQLYSSFCAAINCLLLLLFWNRSRNPKNKGKLFANEGSTFSLMFILYGITRFIIEIFRDDNPFEYGWWTLYRGGTISQNLCIYIFIIGIVFMLLLQFFKPSGKPSNPK